MPVIKNINAGLELVKKEAIVHFISTKLYIMYPIVVQHIPELCHFFWGAVVIGEHTDFKYFAVTSLNIHFTKLFYLQFRSYF